MAGFESQITEVINRNLLVSELLGHGLNAYLPVYDRGVDLIAYDEGRRLILPIQLKGRWIIMKKYRDRGIWIAFPDQGHWYLAPHDKMISCAEEMGYCASASWLDGGAYSVKSMPKKLASLMQRWELGPSLSQAIQI